MTTRRRASWLATTGRRLRKYFSTSPVAGFRRPGREHAGLPFRHRAAPDSGHGVALLVPAAVILAAAAGIAVLAGVADHHLGIPADLHRAKCRLFRPCRRHP